MEKLNSIGLIAEFNPFHDGHKIYLEKAKALDKNAILICALSPNFVQRGEPSCISKEIKVKQALKNGVDLIVEIPTLYAVESAEFYAKAAMQILSELDVDQIIFGTESGDTKTFINKYKTNHNQAPRMDELIEQYLDEGYSYASAKTKAQKEVSNFYLENPNDILGFEYLKSLDELKSSIKVNCYKRLNNEKDPYSTSALALREQFKKDRKVRYKFNFLEDYFSLLKYILITQNNTELSTIHLVEEGIENLLQKNIYKAKNMDEFINLCTSKRYSKARIKRTIIHILLNTKKECAKEYLSQLPYIRVLGFNKKGSTYLRQIQKEKDINLVTRFSANDNPLLRYELKATSLYYFNLKEPNKTKLIEKEMTLFPIIIK